MEDRKTIGFSLSGGGARASAHIGILRALREHGIEADYVAGTSGGAIAGALYAGGLSIDKMLDFATKGNLLKLYKPGIPIKGLTSLDYLKELMGGYIKARTFKELHIPLSIAAANLLTGEKEFFETGDLLQAVMASCAIPLIFKPVEINGQLYADGGIFDNMPVSFLQDKCDIIIGFNVMPNTGIENKDLDNILSIGMRVFDMAASNASRINFSACDVLIEPRGVLEYNIFNFRHAKELASLGYTAGLEQVGKIREMILSEV